ncbi:MAG: NapC/NirT family cytochrome c, partial [Bacteroidales bacterium]|nr:NapC/NirT family cytochrome c [Bacteroidales bacterium]
MKKKRIIWGAVLGGLALGIVLTVALVSADTYTSTNDSYMRCHYHEEADQLWKQSPHYLNGSGVVTDCAACHLPPKEDGIARYYMVKIKMGVKDMWAKMTK